MQLSLLNEVKSGLEEHFRPDSFHILLGCLRVCLVLLNLT